MTLWFIITKKTVKGALGERINFYDSIYSLNVLEPFGLGCSYYNFSLSHEEIHLDPKR